jgi:hypothetical protein
MSHEMREDARRYGIGNEAAAGEVNGNVLEGR